MVNKFLNLSAKDSKGLDIPIYKNALQLKKDAELIADSRKSYSSATSLLILSTEEVIKSILVFLHAEGYGIYKTQGAKKIFSNHKIRHQIAQLMEMGFGFVNSVLKYKEEKTTNLSEKHWFKKIFIVTFDVLKAAEPLLSGLEKIKKLQAFNTLKNKGFYVDYQDELIVPQTEVTAEIYNETLAIANSIFGFSKSLRILHHPNLENHEDSEELKETKAALKKLIDDHVKTFSFNKMDKAMDKL